MKSFRSSKLVGQKLLPENNLSAKMIFANDFA
jgi:hypothetical protein